MSDNVNAMLNRCFLRFQDRAEKFEMKQIVDTFVSVGPLLDVLANKSHQVIYGRRGVGKTHAMKYFSSIENRNGNLAIYVDCQNIGSNQSIYQDTSLPISERATRLLIDVCSAMHWAFLDAFSDPKRNWNLADAAQVLDEFADALSEISIVGEYEVENKRTVRSEVASDIGVRGTISAAPQFDVNAGSKKTREKGTERIERSKGQERASIDFNFLMQQTRKVAEYVAPNQIWLLIDEWSTVPQEIQPYLADLLRRSFFSIPNISIKVAAIEHRSKFKIDRKNGGYIGCELGADISVAANLDDYLVFDANPDRAVLFFRNLITNHTLTIGKEIDLSFDDVPRASLINRAFTQENVFIEFVRASEGVPRDAMHILSGAAQGAATVPISMPNIRHAALQFFQTDKYNAIAASPENRVMLEWIRFKVINERKTRAFLLSVDDTDEIINRLFDLRALHIFSRSMSAAHRPGERFMVYKLDYGCYVDLINTDKYPSGGLFAGDPSMTAIYEVPEDDARSYRRAILDLSEFYKQHPDHNKQSQADLKSWFKKAIFRAPFSVHFQKQ